MSYTGRLLLLATLAGCGDGPGTPQGSLLIEPSVVAFGEVVVGLLGRQTLVITNQSQETVRVSDVRLSDGLDGDFRFDRVPAAILPAGVVDVDVVFAPATPGTRAGKLTLITDGDPEAVAVDVSGIGVSPSLVAVPPSVDFGRVLVGETASVAVTIRNDGSGRVTVDAITPDLETAEEFSVGPYSLQRLEAGESFTFDLFFMPEFNGRALGRVVVGDDSQRPQPLFIRVEGEGVDGDLDVEPRSLNFSGVLVSETRTRTFEIRNTGTGTHTVDSITLLTDQPHLYRLILPPDGQPPFQLGPSQERLIALDFSPEIAGSYEGFVEVVSDGLSEPVRVRTTAEVPVAPSASMRIAPEALRFGAVTVGGAFARRIALINAGDIPVNLLSAPAIIPSTAPIRLEGAPGANETLLVDERHLFDVIFEPTASATTSAVLRVVTDVTSAPIRDIPLMGRGATAASADVEVAPLELRLGRIPRGRESVGYVDIANQGDALLQVTGFAIDGPPGGLFSLLNGPGSISVAAGETAPVPIRYFDPLGLALAHTATLTITTDDADAPVIRHRITAGTEAPRIDEDVDLEVVLTWDTGGTNLDLHLVQAAGDLFDDPLDACWCNPNPRWDLGFEGPPLLLADVRDGFGPELLLLAEPPNDTMTLNLEVHYREPAGGPLTHARIEIFKNAVLVRARERTLGAGQRWSVGEIFRSSGGQFLFTDSARPLDTPPVQRCF